METLIFVLVILTIGSIIGISMISFRIAITSLVKVKSLEEELVNSKPKKTKSLTN